jgi:hypothetical protein
MSVMCTDTKPVGNKQRTTVNLNSKDVYAMENKLKKHRSVRACCSSRLCFKHCLQSKRCCTQVYYFQGYFQAYVDSQLSSAACGKATPVAGKRYRMHQMDGQTLLASLMGQKDVLTVTSINFCTVKPCTSSPSALMKSIVSFCTHQIALSVAALEKDFLRQSLGICFANCMYTHAYTRLQAVCLEQPVADVSAVPGSAQCCTEQYPKMR